MSDFDCVVQEQAEEFARARYGCRLELLRDEIQTELCSEAADYICENTIGEE
ncbi:hypothetical protein LCGC14_1510190 [marine sediment metagenome]|uniref:Uncharacterized protein n=1 Tax=marine sediment metagenome TaxID=412755 RepID=A0A0F9J1Q0_9ZZZZ